MPRLHCDRDTEEAEAEHEPKVGGPKIKRKDERSLS